MKKQDDKLVRLLLKVIYQEVDAHAEVEEYFAERGGKYLGLLYDSEKYEHFLKETR